MIVEMRTYTFQFGTVPKFLAIYEEKGLPIQKPILGNLLGYFTTETGTLNQTVHLWGYDSLDERARRRALLMAETGWRAFLAEIQPFLLNQESRILLPTGFSPIK